MSAKPSDAGTDEPNLPELRTLHERLSLAVSVAALAFWDWNLETDTMTFSPSWLEAFGYDEDELAPVPGSREAMIHPGDRERAAKTMASHLASELPDYECELRLGAKSGEYRRTVERARVVERSPSGEPLRVIGFETDITEQKTAEAALLESRRTLDALLENAAQGIVTSREDGTIDSANKTAETILGYERGELRGERIEALLPRSLSEKHTTHRAKYFSSPRNRPMGIGMDLTALRKDGTTVPVEISLSHIRRDEGSLVVSFLTDISERKKAEEQRQSLQRQLEHATKMEAVGRLAGGIAHDFNNLLTALSGFSEIVLDQLEDEHPLREGAEEVKRLCERSASLVRQLLTVSRKQIMEPLVLNLNERVAEMEKLLRGLIGEDVVLHTELGDDVGSIRADPGQLEQVILNLLVNARDAMPDGGTVTIETDDVSYGDSPTSATGPSGGDYVRLLITDTGVGMAPETLSHIYEPFFTTKERGKGTGLGLATVYGIVNQSGGTIEASSQLGRGTRFEIHFPRVAPRAAAASPDEPAARGDTARECILVVEDEKVVRMVARDALQKAGYDVIEARDGAEALDVVARHRGPLHLVVTDVVMPVMGGLELVEHLEKKHPDLDVVFMSGHVDDSRGRQRILQDRHAFLEKPFTRAALQRKVREMLDRSDRR